MLKSDEPLSEALIIQSEEVCFGRKCSLRQELGQSFLFTRFDKLDALITELRANETQRFTFGGFKNADDDGAWRPGGIFGEIILSLRYTKKIGEIKVLIEMTIDQREIIALIVKGFVSVAKSQFKMERISTIRDIKKIALTR